MEKIICRDKLFFYPLTLLVVFTFIASVSPSVVLAQEELPEPPDLDELLGPDTPTSAASPEAEESRDTETTSESAPEPLRTGPEPAEADEPADSEPGSSDSEPGMSKEISVQPEPDTVDLNREIDELKETVKSMRSRMNRLDSEVKRLRRKVGEIDTGSAANVAGSPERGQEEQILEPEPQPTAGGSSSGVNPNLASLEELKQISGVTKLLAERIVWYRDVVNTFTERQDLRQVPGMSVDTFEQVKSDFAPGPYPENN